MKNDKVSSILLFDVGGTTIKCNAFYGGRTILPLDIVVPSSSSSSKSEILSSFYETIKKLKKESSTDEITGLAFGFPGPFDYEKGIPYIRGVGKYESLYGIDFRKELCSIDTDALISSSQFVFVNDIDAFALGVFEKHEELERGRTLFVAIGTGTGSAFAVDGELRTSGPGIPENGWIYSLPFRNSIIDDYVSARGLAGIAEKVTGRKMEGKDLSRLAEKGDRKAIAVYDEFGRSVGEALLSVISSFSPDRIVIGGNIAKANVYFGSALENAAGQIPVIYIDDTSSCTFKGLESVFRRKYGIQV